MFILNADPDGNGKNVAESTRHESGSGAAEMKYGTLNFNLKQGSRIPFDRVRHGRIHGGNLQVDG